MNKNYCPICDFECPYCKGDDFICVLETRADDCDDWIAYNEEE